MQVKILVHKDYEEMEVHVCHHEKSERMLAVAKQIDNLVNLTITGMDEKGAKIMNVEDVIRFYTQEQKVLAQDKDGTATIPFKLYELEEKLDGKRFVRISKSEIVNLKKIKRLDMSVSGTIKVIFYDESWTYTSRRNVTRLKNALGCGRRAE